MTPAVARYLEKRAQLCRWPLCGRVNRQARLTVVIPALAEYPQLFDTLSGLATAPWDTLERTQVIIVVNHRDSAPEAWIANNRKTLNALDAYAGPLPVAWVEAVPLGEKEGVGTARKAGLDWAVSVLSQNNADTGGLVCLDADTTVDAAYLPSVHAFFAVPNRWAAVLDYAHPIDAESPETEAILRYEIWLRQHELGLAFAGSPYAFPTIGSAMACTVSAYVAVSGMNQRQAGEDFYFLQQLAKTGVVERVPGTTIIPSARASQRVPFGTGRHVSDYLEAPSNARAFYHPECYLILKSWLATVKVLDDAPADRLFEEARTIHPALAAFLEQQRFGEIWERLRKENKTPPRRESAFHAWFDAFATIKLFHHLRGLGFPDSETLEAPAQIAEWFGAAKETAARPLLETLRRLCRDRAHAVCGCGAISQSRHP